MIACKPKYEYACADCGREQDAMNRPCERCRSPRVVDVEVIEQVAGPGWRLNFPADPKRRVVVGFSGGVTSAWCAGWAKRTYPTEEIVLLWHDTKEEDPDTCRFLREMAAALGMPITERSDGRSVTEVFEDEGFLGNNQNAMCSRILKVEQGDKFFAELRAQGRVQRAWARAEAHGYEVRFPVAETGTTKQECADWCNCEMGVKPSAMYEHFDHANCRGCVKGGKAYWLKTLEVYPDVYWQRSGLEDRFGHGILRGGGREHHLLKDLVRHPLKREVRLREAIEIGPCECGD